jgi:hypothetical protein
LPKRLQTAVHLSQHAANIEDFVLKNIRRFGADFIFASPRGGKVTPADRSPSEAAASHLDRA